MPPLTSPRRRALLAVVASGGALLSLVPAAQADVLAFGSNLSAPATQDAIQARQADTAFWPTKMASGGGFVVPADGEILSIRVKGMAPRNRDERPPRPDGKPNPGGETMFHYQVLEPLPGGKVRIRERTDAGSGTSSTFFLPTSGDPQQINTYATAARMCARAGDYVAFNTVGGFDAVGDQSGGYQGKPLSPYPMGTPLQIFAKVPGSVTANYEKADGTNNGDILTPAPLDGIELLMEATMGTGADANQVCGGTKGYVAPPPPKVQPNGQPVAPPSEVQLARIVSGKISLNKKSITTITLKCAATKAQVKAQDYGSCLGVLRLDAKKGSRTVTVGKANYQIAGRANQAVKVKLTKAGKKLFKKSKQKLKVSVVAVTQPGGSKYTTSERFTLKRFGK